MLCQFSRLIYPQDIRAASPDSYMVAVYNPCGKVCDADGNEVAQIKAVGYGLPVSGKLRYEMEGHWSRNSKHGLQFEVTTYNEVIIPTKEGVIAYLSSGQIKGIGPKLAEHIYNTFGNMALEVLDKEPEKLLSISGISTAKLKKIRDSYLANRAARDVVAFLTPHGITANRAVKLYRQYKDETMDIVKNHPYRLCEMTGIGFATADRIAASMGISPLSPERVDEGLLYTLIDAEGHGNLCLEKHAFIGAAVKLLETDGLTSEMVVTRAARLLSDGKLVSYHNNIYRRKTAEAEATLASLIYAQRTDRPMYVCKNLDSALNAEEAKLGFRLAAEQRKAVTTALTEGLSIITGGPGTGKTAILRAILDIYKRQHPNGEICCCAPTGRAARRMEQSAGHPASTIHRALGLMANDDGEYGEPHDLSADFVVVDEISMLDVGLAVRLFAARRRGCQMVLIGDADQLPSVGPGAVLSEMLISGCVPTIYLDRVFRQNAGSRIAINAKLMRHGNVGLEYGNDFQFIDSPDMVQSADKLVQLYLQEAAKQGIDNVAMLSPFRQKTETGVNALNVLLRDQINPASPSKPEMVRGTKIFRQGDKVMQTRNREDVSNGDIGYITKIDKTGTDITMQVDFGDGRIMEYEQSDLDTLELGYATTVHKSQGAEYNTVIMNLQCAHYIMLTRPLVYTAITRGKDKVIIVGERKALCMAIKRTDADKRGTCLAIRLQELQFKS